jgi:hypothetical protein
VGHLPRRVPLLRRAAGRHRRQRARCRFRHALGLRLERGAVRTLAGGRLEAFAGGLPRTSQPARHDEQRTAAGLGAGKRREGVHDAAGSWSARDNALRSPRSTLPVYQRQLFPEQRAGRRASSSRSGETLYENDGVRLWTCRAATWHRHPVVQEPRCTPSATKVLDGVREAIARPSATSTALVIWQPKGRSPSAPTWPRSVRCSRPASSIGSRRGRRLPARPRRRSNTRRCRSSPRCRAWRWAVVANSSCTPRAVVALESYIGLVEAGVGLIPAGGGCKEFALRAAAVRRRFGDEGSMNFLQSVFQTIAMAQVSKSARQRRRLGLLKPTTSCSTMRTNCCTSHAATRADGRQPATAGAAGARHPGGRRSRHRDAGDDAGEHARGRHDHRPTTTSVAAPPPWRCAAARSKPAAQVDEQWLLKSSASRIRRTAEDAGNPGAHRAHAGNRQAPAELRRQVMSKQIQDAYIVAATRTAGGKAQGRHVQSCPPRRHAGARAASVVDAGAGIDLNDIGDVVVGCAMPEGEQGMNVARIGLLLAGLPNTVPGMTINRFCASPACRRWPMPPTRSDWPGRHDDRRRHRVDDRDADHDGQQDDSESACLRIGRHVAIAYGMGLTAEKVATQWQCRARTRMRSRVASHHKALAAIAAGRVPRRDAALHGPRHLPDLATIRCVDRERCSTPTKARARIPRSRHWPSCAGV